MTGKAEVRRNKQYLGFVDRMNGGVGGGRGKGKFMDNNCTCKHSCVAYFLNSPTLFIPSSRPSFLPLFLPFPRIGPICPVAVKGAHICKSNWLQADRRVDIATQTLTDGQTDRQTDWQTYIHSDRQTQTESIHRNTLYCTRFLAGGQLLSKKLLPQNLSIAGKKKKKNHFFPLCFRFFFFSYDYFYFFSF